MGGAGERHIRDAPGGGMLMLCLDVGGNWAYGAGLDGVESCLRELDASYGDERFRLEPRDQRPLCCCGRDGERPPPRELL
jgi:hypothetical protein